LLQEHNAVGAVNIVINAAFIFMSYLEYLSFPRKILFPLLSCTMRAVQGRLSSEACAFVLDFV